jgi:FAD/FMN-containing dehydrogenase
MVSVVAGTPLSEIDAALRPHGQFFAVRPPAGPGATVGGTIATGCAGPLQLGHGTPRDHVLGLQLVTGDGRVLDLGGRVVKNVAGYDLVRLLVGSRGSLGLITRAFLRLRPQPARDITAVFRSEAAEPLVRKAIAMGDGWPVAVELLDPDTAATLLPGQGLWTLAARWTGNDSFADDRLARLARDGGAEVLAADFAERLWEGLARLEAEATTAVRLATLPDRLGDLVAAAGRIAGVSDLLNSRSDKILEDPLGIYWRLAAHARSGIVRLWSTPAAPGPADAWHSRYVSVLQSIEQSISVTELIGTGPGARLDGGPEARLRSGIRQAFDPAGILARALGHARRAGGS